MAYDAARHRTVMFGGFDAGVIGDTWELDGATWRQRSPATSPPPRYQTAMAYDAARGRVVLFGGTRRWPAGRYVGVRRHHVDAAPAGESPHRRGSAHALAYDARRNGRS